MQRKLTQFIAEFVVPLVLGAVCYFGLWLCSVPEPQASLASLTTLFLFFLGGEAAIKRFYRLREEAYFPEEEVDKFLHALQAMSLLSLILGFAVFVGVHWYLDDESYVIPILSAFPLAIFNYYFGLPMLVLDRTVRGRRLLTLEEAQAIADRIRPPDDPGLLFGGVRLPSEAANKGTAIIGTAGSGKTMTLAMLCQDVLAQIGKGRGQRALVYDPKTVILPHLAGMGVSLDRILILNPFDARCVAPNFQASIDTPGAALQFATQLIPEETGSHNRFFSDAARDILTGVLRSFMKKGPRVEWDLRDVVLSAQSAKWIWQLTQSTPETKHLGEYFTEGRAWANIHATLKTHLGKFEPIAALYQGRKKLKLEEWLNGEYCLVLGNHEALRAAIDPINKLIVKRIGEELLAVPDPGNKQSWILLDELRDMGMLDGLHSLLLKGREKNVCTVLVIHDTEGLQAVYSRPVSEEMLSLCNQKAILLLGTPGAAAWASQLLGGVESIQERRTKNEGGSFGSEEKRESVSNELTKSEPALPSEFLSMKATSRENGLSGYYFSPYIGAWYANLPGDYIERTLRPKDPTALPNLIPRPKSDQHLLPWTEADLKRLGLDPRIEPPNAQNQGRPQGVPPPPPPPPPDARTEDKPQVVPTRNQKAP